MRLTGYPVFFLTVSQLKKSGGLNNPNLMCLDTGGWVTEGHHAYKKNCTSIR